MPNNRTSFGSKWKAPLRWCSPLFLFLLLLAGCTPKNTQVKFVRFERLIFNTPPHLLQQTLVEQHSTYATPLLNIHEQDPQYMQMLEGFVADPVLQDIYHATDSLYPTLAPIERKLGKALARMAEICPTLHYNRFYTLITADFDDYQNRVYCDDSTLCLSIDHYAVAALQKYNYFGVPLYMQRMLTPEHIAADCMAAIAGAHIALPNGELTILDHMVAAGKVLYFLEQVMPSTPDTIRLRYTRPQLQWMQQNTANAWGWIVQQQMLFSTNPQHYRLLMDEGPKTNDLGDGSAPRIGAYIGLQIVRAYAKRSHCSMQELFDLTDSQQILSKSAWRP